MSSYGQHAPSSSFQQDSALVAQFASRDYAERDPRPLAPSDIPEEVAAWNDTALHESRPSRLAIGQPVHKPEPYISANERSPLLQKPSVPRINETHESSHDGSGHDFDYRKIFFDEVKTLARYTLPVFGCVSLFLFRNDYSHPVSYLPAAPTFWRYSRLSIPDTLVLTLPGSTRSLLPVLSPLATSPPMLLLQRPSGP